MAHRTFQELGNHVALNSWGFDDKGDLHNTIRSMEDPRKMVCLLASIVAKLDALTEELYRLQKNRDISTPDEKPDKTRDPVADGMFRWLNGDKPIFEMDIHRLSTRARKVLMRSGIIMRSQITREALSDIRNCGETTINEILDWAYV